MHGIGRHECAATRNRSWERELVAECEGFLTGRFAERLASEKRRVPAWAWLMNSASVVKV